MLIIIQHSDVLKCGRIKCAVNYDNNTELTRDQNGMNYFQRYISSLAQFLKRNQILEMSVTATGN